MTEHGVDPFDLADDLPEGGTLLLEASAGTGKTWTIAALVVRMVAEGRCRLDDMLVITFTRSATRELRDRVRAGLSRAAGALDAALAAVAEGDASRPDPEVEADLALLVDADAATLEQRRRRLRQALASFDAATIATIHEFCQQVLRELGIAGTTDTDATLVEDLGDLWREVIDDAYLRGSLSAAPPDFSLADARSIAWPALGDPWSELAPDPEAGSRSVPAEAARRVRFAAFVREEVERRKERLGVWGFDDLLRHVRQALTDGAAGADHADADTPAAARMRARWRVVLVDEFQDTDPTQWEVLRTAFAGHATLVLIGDPKQAIYGFRGGDIVTYHRATAQSTQHRTLPVNHRSDGPLVDGLQALLRGVELGEGITVTPVRAAQERSRILGPDGAPLPPVRLRTLTVDDLPTGKYGPPIGAIRERVDADLVHDVRDLLTRGVTVDGAPVRPADIAVLAHRHSDLTRIQAGLRAVGIPAVVAGGGSVFRTDAATEWIVLLEALLHPFHDGWVRAAALTPFVGLRPEDLDDPATETVRTLLLRWADAAHASGVAAALEGARIGGMEARLLAAAGGERLLTDLEHVGQLAHEAGRRDHLQVPGVLAWLRDRVREEQGEGITPRTRRLDSDAEAVQLSTVHGSKGLQYPIVYLPSLADRYTRKTIDHPRYHGDPPERLRTLDVGGRHAGAAAASARHKAEEAEESLRLLYVALTRAQSQVVTWWFPSGANTPPSPLHRVLFGRVAGEPGMPPETVPLPRPDAWRERLTSWVDAGALAWEPVPPSGTPAPLPAQRVAHDLGVRTLRRHIDTAWRRLSYSRLSAPLQDLAHGGGVGSEPETTPREDEALAAGEAATTPSPALPVDSPASPWAQLPVGATFGSLVHDLLEHADPEASDLELEVRARLADAWTRWPLGDDLDAETLVTAVLATLRSPLGPAAPGTTLADIPLHDRLAELEFELPLSGGEANHDGRVDGGTVVLADLAGLLRRHLPEGDPLLPYADTLEQVPDLGSQPLRGYLTGSVDAVLRVGDRHLIVDYKTNWLGPRESTPEHPHLLLADYGPSPLAQAMGHSDYPLQAVLYAVVLHRYLRWRLPDYDPHRHLGGVLYLYVRGMGGPETPVIDGHPCGVFTWSPPVALVEDLSALLDGDAGATA